MSKGKNAEKIIVPKVTKKNLERSLTRTGDRFAVAPVLNLRIPHAGAGGRFAVTPTPPWGCITFFSVRIC